MRFAASRRRTAGFTLIELLVVIVIITILLGMSIFAVIAFVKSHGLENSGNIVKSAATKARAKAIATRDICFMLIFIREVNYPLDTPNDPNAPLRTFRSSENTIVLVDENARAGTANYTQWLQKLDEPIGLPKQSKFCWNGGGAGSVIEIQFSSDGSLLIAAGTTDRASTQLRLGEAAYDAFLTGAEASIANNFDVAITNLDQTSVCFMDFVTNTGSVDFLVFPQ